MSDLEGIQLHYLSSIDDMQELKRWLGERRPVLGIDTETGGFDWWRQPLRMVQVGDAMSGWAIPFDDWKGVAKEIIPSYTGPIVFHNWKFDALFLEQNGVEVPRRNLHDSLVLCHLENAALPRALKAAASRYIDRGFAAGQAKLDETMAKEGWTWATIPVDYGAYWQYAALDPVMAARLWEMFQHHTSLPVYDVEIRSTDVLLRAERRGYRIDEAYCHSEIEELRLKAKACRQWALDQFGVENLTSDTQVVEWLERNTNWEPVVFTDSGRPSLKKDVAEHLPFDLVQCMLACKHAEKMAGAYLENFLEYSVDGRVHAKINPLGARTGRMSVTEPALQTLPREDVVARDAFIPSSGSKLVLCDYDQIEARLTVHFAGAESMYELFGQPVDFFTAMARRLYQAPDIQKHDVQRDYCKRGLYAKIYGAGAAKFSMSVGLSEESGTQFLNALDAAYPELPALQAEVARVGEARERDEGTAYVTTPFGRRHPLAHRDGVYKLLNYLVQGTAGDVLKAKIVELDAAGIADYLVLPVHDELDFDVPEPLVYDACKVIGETMPANDYAVPITVGIDVVDRWGDKYRKESR